MIEFRALGSFELLGRDGQTLQSVLAQPKRQALLAYLALARPQGFHRRDTILGLLWPELDDTHARAALNKAVHQLRGSLRAEAVVSRGQDELGLDWQRFWCDAAGFEAAIELGELAEALALYRGDLLPGFHIEEAAEFDQWLERERYRLRQRAINAAQTLSDRAETARDVWGAVRWTQRALQLDPLNEVNVRRLMLLFEQNAGRAEALRAYEELAKALETEIGVEPSAETRALREALRAREPGAGVPVTLPTAAAVVLPPITREDVQLFTQTAQPRNRVIPNRLVTALTLALVIGLTAFLVGRRNGRANEVKGAELSIAVLPFELDADTSLQALGAEAISLLSERLDKLPDFAAVRPRIVRKWADPGTDSFSGAELRAVASRLRARFLVTGRLVHYANRLTITAVLHDTLRAGSARTVAVARNELNDLPALIDDVVAQFASVQPARLLTLDGTGVDRSSLSADAIRDFLAGQQLYVRGRYSEAVVALRRAAEADTAYALAYFFLSLSANFSGDGALTGWAIDRALHFERNLAPLDRLQLRAWQAYLGSAPQEAESLVRTALAHHPGDWIGSYILGEVLFHWGPLLGWPLDDAAAAFDGGRALESNFVGALIHRARLAAMQGDAAILDSLAARQAAFPLEPDQQIEMDMLAALNRNRVQVDVNRLCAALQGRPQSVVLHTVTVLTVAYPDRADLGCVPAALRQKEYDTNAHGWSWLLAAQLAMARGRPSEAVRILRGSRLPPARVLEYRAALASGPFAQTDTLELRELRDALNAHGQNTEPSLDVGSLSARAIFWPRRSFLEGMTSLRIGDAATASRIANELATPTGADVRAAPHAQVYSRILRAELLRTRGKRQDALDMLGKPRVPPDFQLPAILSFPYAHDRWLRAELLHELGRAEEALRWYGTFPDPGGYDLMYLAPSHLRRAQIHELAGNAALARRHYERALALWASAEAPLQDEVGTIRTRLAALR